MKCYTVRFSPLCSVSTVMRMARQATTEIFIDFEGNEKLPPTFLGVLERTNNQDVFRQFVFEDAFSILAPSAQHSQLRVATLDDVLREIDAQHGLDVPIYAWSNHEQEVISSLLGDSPLGLIWANRIVDAKKLAKVWARTKHPEHKFEKKDFRGRHTLDQYLELIEYKVPTVHGAGKTGSRLTKIRAMIIDGRQFDDWPKSIKGHWTKLLAHNMHDFYGMMAIVDRINADT